MNKKTLERKRKLFKIKKRLFSLFPIAAIICSITACGNFNTSEGDDIQKNDGPVEIGVYHMYDLDTYMRPIWKDRVVHNETVMFVGKDDKAQLLYEADEIISLRSYDLKTEYQKGIDYDYVDGQLVLLPGSSIPCISEEEYYTNDNTYSMLQTKGNEGTGTSYTYWGEGDTMTKWQVAVPYQHSQFWKGYVPESFADRYEKLAQKLQNGEDVVFVFYGDSITFGANASFMIGAEPYMPTWSQLFTQYIAKQYGYTVKYVRDEFTEAPVPAEDTVFGTNGTITYYNPSVGGWTVEQGYQNAEERVNAFVSQYGCDLFTVAFGMNNPSLASSKFVQYTEGIVKRVQEQAPEMNVALVSTMVPNPDATNGWYGNQEMFEAEMRTLADELNENGTGCAVAPMTSMSKAVLETKRFWDVTGNNINHPNDFMGRVYAQVMVETVFGYEE